MDCEIGDGSDKVFSRKLAFGFRGQRGFENHALNLNYSSQFACPVNFVFKVVKTKISFLFSMLQINRKIFDIALKFGFHVFSPAIA